MMFDLFAGGGGFASLVLVAALLMLRAVVVTLPAIIWSLRCPRDAGHYRVRDPVISGPPCQRFSEDASAEESNHPFT